MSIEWEEKLVSMSDEEKKDVEKMKEFEISIKNKLQALKSVVDSKLKDPVTSCKVYKEIGCSHVDGFLCNMDTCSILGEYKNGY